MERLRIVVRTRRIFPETSLNSFRAMVGWSSVTKESHISRVSPLPFGKERRCDSKGANHRKNWHTSMRSLTNGHQKPACGAPGLIGWKTAALIYEGLEWEYYYCYECKRWFRRHFRLRYAVALVDDDKVISLLLKQLESRKVTLEAEFESLSRFRSRISAASRFFQRFLP